MSRRLIYPIYQLGNPQLRIFRPTVSMTLVRPGKEQPSDTVQFRIPMQMTKFDVRNYLEKIYSVPVSGVRTRIQYCSNKKRNHLNQRVKRPDYKVAYVQLVSVFPWAVTVEKNRRGIGQRGEPLEARGGGKGGWRVHGTGETGEVTEGTLEPCQNREVQRWGREVLSKIKS
uniref:Large ribosomal subunit protein uL23m n=1 Tax=Astyanax mexicanus TaxID=7994 RepID=W5LBP2_ASTMX